MDYMQLIEHRKVNQQMCACGHRIGIRQVATPGLLVAIAERPGWALAAVVSVVMTAVWFHGRLSTAATGGCGRSRPLACRRNVPSKASVR